ncbi:MAG: hypothetical protein KGL45_11870 [Gammaproteobacteria bacterium]|nr:hypothetical protein [Gammaproteobacteria bacterium]
MTIPDEVLMAYADDELDAETRAAVEAAIASDPEVARRIAQHRALRNRIHSAFNKVLDEPVPARLSTAARSEPAGPRKDNVVPLRHRPASRWTWPQWTAIAASLLVGVIAGRLALLRSSNPGPIVMKEGRVLAAGALADALSDQLAGDQTAAGSVRIGVSFRSKSGEYCRTFTLSQPAALAGLACRAADAWRVGVLARTESSAGGSGSYRQAASPIPPAVTAAVGNQIAGEPLDAHAEAVARAQHWQR